jgi:inositol transport system permease protein
MTNLLAKRGKTELCCLLDTRRSNEVGIFVVLLGIMAIFEAFGWLHANQSFVFNSQRAFVIVLQMAVIGIMAIGVAQVIILGGIDLSGGSIVGIAGIVTATFAQIPGSHAYFPQLTNLPVFVPISIGLALGAGLGLINGCIIAVARIPPFIGTLAMLVIARGLAHLYTSGKQQSGFSAEFLAVGAHWTPILIFVGIAIIFHILLAYTVYGRRTYAIGSNEQAARMAGIDIVGHKILVYSLAGLLYGLAAVVQTSRAQTAQSSTGTMWELDAISAAVIGGTSLLGGRGGILGVVIGVLIMGVITSGFNFLDIGVFYVALAKGVIIVAAVVADRFRFRKRR